MSFYRIFSKIYERAAKKMCLDCTDFIEKGSKMLDLGCGSGIVGKEFQDFFQAEMIGVDIQDTRVVNLPFKIIDGENLPFNDNEFDIALINYVLHHARNPKRLIEEAKRVSKKIIIYENLPEGIFAKFFCQIHLITFNLFFQRRNPTKYYFKTEREWEEIFKEMGIRVVFKKRVTHSPLDKIKFGKRILFILEKV